MTINGLEPPPEFKIDPGLRKIPTETALFYGANRSRLTRAYLDYLRWGGFSQLKEIDDEESRRRYIKGVVVEKILRYDLPARFRGENSIDLEMLYGIYASEYGQIVEYNTLARDVGVSVGRQEIDFMLHVQDVVFPVECKTGRLRSNNTRLIRALAEKWGAPFSVMVTSDTFDFSDPSILRVPAFML
jgi:hypothetical protein